MCQSVPLSCTPTKKETLAQGLSREFCKTLKNTPSTKGGGRVEKFDINGWVMTSVFKN